MKEHTRGTQMFGGGIQRVLLPLVVVGLFGIAIGSAFRLPSGGDGLLGPVGQGQGVRALEYCLRGDQPFAARLACYRRILEPNVARQGPKVVLEQLDALQGERPVFRAYCHEMAHVLGRYWIQAGGTLGQGFHEGSYICHNGFYHGMVERVILGDRALGAEWAHVQPAEIRAKAPSVCTTETVGASGPRLLFQCLHGLGHALDFAVGYDLPLALELCDLLPDQWSRDSCHGGAVMENITGVERDLRMLRAGDAHYPCTVLAPKYRDACYRMQTSWMIEDGMGWDAIIAACREAGPHQTACFQSLGRDVSPRVRQHGPDGFAGICANLPTEERTSCLRGAVYALSDHTTDGRFAYPFCQVFADPALRAECFAAAHAHLLGLLERTPGQLDADCRSHVAGSPDCLTTLASARPD